jgi:uncharacterized protein YkwD
MISKQFLEGDLLNISIRRFIKAASLTGLCLFLFAVSAACQSAPLNRPITTTSGTTTSLISETIFSSVNVAATPTATISEAATVPTSVAIPTPSLTPVPTAAPTVKPTTPKLTTRPATTTTAPPTAPATEPTIKSGTCQINLADVPDNWPLSTVQQGRVDAFIDLVNNARIAKGLPALIVGGDGQRRMAAIRAAEISILFSHNRPTNDISSNQWSQLLPVLNIDHSIAGENIAGINSPEAAMDAFMNSEGHRENILSADFTKIAIGVYTDSAGRDWWAQEFVG